VQFSLKPNCNGGYWLLTSVQEDSTMIVSFLRTVLGTEIKKKIADLALASLGVLKDHKAQPKPTREDLEQKLRTICDICILIW
jgi:hypothetical protein